MQTPNFDPKPNWRSKFVHRLILMVLGLLWAGATMAWPQFAWELRQNGNTDGFIGLAVNGTLSSAIPVVTLGIALVVRKMGRPVHWYAITLASLGIADAMLMFLSLAYNY